MKFVFASDSFKGSLSSAAIAGLLDRAAREVFDEVQTVKIALADGGEGTAEAVLAFSAEENGGSCAKAVEAEVHGPLMEPVRAVYALFDDGRAVLDMASASGLTLIPEDRRDPLATTSYGTGELLADALSKGTRDITIGIGGSATNDGGMGFLKALGTAFYDDDGNSLEGRGRDLAAVSRADLSGLDKRLCGARITVMCDVDNPLTGSNGATYVYGPQKGASAKALKELESGMKRFKDVIEEVTCIDCDKVPGAGAAGGMGAALHAFLGAELRPGIELMLDITGFDRAAEGADMVITGEGRADSQSLHGKAMMGVGMRAKEKGIPVTAICGCLGSGWEGLLDCGIQKIIPLAGGSISNEEAMARAEEIYYEKALRLFSDIRAGSA